MVHRLWQPSEIEGVWVGEKDTNGPIVGVLGAVHGHEPTGAVVVRQLLERAPPIDCGTIIAMIGNPAAEGVRKFTEKDLNRCFRPLTDDEAGKDFLDLPYEVQRAQLLRTVLDQCVSILDIHNTTDKLQLSNTREPGWFIICERIRKTDEAIKSEDGLSTARAIGAPIISIGWSLTESGGSDGYMANQGKEGICFEAGQMDDHKRNYVRANGAVARYLTAHGLSEGSLPPLYEGQPVIVQTDKAVMRTSEDYRLTRQFRNFEDLELGELVAVSNNIEIRAEENHVIIFPHENPPIGGEAFTLGHRIPN